MKKLFTLFLFSTLAIAIQAQTMSWIAQTSGTNSTLRDVHFVSSMMGWAVGDNGTILKTTDGGATWGPQASGETEIIRACFFLDANNGWICGGSLSQILRKTIDGGATWADITASNIASDQLRDIAFADQNVGYVISWDSIYRTTDGGTTWMVESYTTSVQGGLVNEAVAVTNDSMAFVAGERIQTGPSSQKQPEVFDRRPFNAPLLWGTNGANSFANSDRMKSIAFANDSVGFAGGQEGKLFRMQSDNINYNGPWDLSKDISASGATRIRSISFPTSNIGMFNSSVEVAGTTYAVVYHTLDGGDSWSSQPDSIEGLLGGVLHSPDSVSAWMVGSLGAIYKGTRLAIGVEEDFRLSNVKLFPNPTNGTINLQVQSESHKDYRFQVMNFSGQMLFEEEWRLEKGMNKTTLDLEQYSEGIYFIVLTSPEGKFTTLKVNKY